MLIPLTLSCFCGEQTSIEVDMPENWHHRYDGMYEGDCFCPKHKKVSDFADKQCSGCVGGWGECDLFKAFAYGKSTYTDNRRPLDENDFAVMRKGICPRRVNGTITFHTETGEMNQIHLDEKADDELGVALEQAIKEYIEKYKDVQ